MTPEPLSQPMRALRDANHVRFAIADVKRSIRTLNRRDGARRAAQILRDPRGPALTIRVGQLLRSVEYVGASRAALWLREAGVTFADRPLRSLTVRQRGVLADRLEEFAG